MKNLNFESYFKNTNTQYCDPKYVITILENILGKKLDRIKKGIKNKQIVVSNEQIEEYLEKTFEEKDPELKKRIGSPKPIRKKTVFEWTREEVKISSQEVIDSLKAQQYCFEPYTLEYFKRYTNIIRNKVLLLLNIIEKIGNRDSQSIQDLMKELDIQLDENGNILKDDIIRLITPTIYNINELNKKVNKANKLSTYLTFKISKDSLYRDDWSEGEIYPTESLQTKGSYYGYIEGNVPFTDNQIAELKGEQAKSMKKWLNLK